MCVGLCVGFAVYNTAADSFLAYSKVLTNRYNAPYLEGAVSVSDYVNGIDASPYATDTSYGSKLNSIINTYNLTQYDLAYKQFDKNGLDGYTASGSVTGTATGTGATQTGSGGWIESLKQWIIDHVAEPLTTTTFLILLAVAAVVFFMRAFPATSGAVDSTVKAVKKIKKG